ncbi:hypothetical protein ACFY2T_41105 [Streptomyces sp. NPDC001260]|uniref:hypothetical protein n=1 Tax=Streptomyces sp. NPDC001260 TaxID=3364551 RepID=UPI003680EFD7
MRRATILLTACLLATGATGCSKSADDTAKDCAAALTPRTGGNASDKPTVSEAKKRVDALDTTLADLVHSGYDGVAKDAYDTLEQKTKEGGKGRPKACKPLSEDDYTTLLAAKAINGLGWTDKDGQFDKLKMAQHLGN